MTDQTLLPALEGAEGPVAAISVAAGFAAFFSAVARCVPKPRLLFGLIGSLAIDPECLVSIQGALRKEAAGGMPATSR